MKQYLLCTVALSFVAMLAWGCNGSDDNLKDASTFSEPTTKTTEAQTGQQSEDPINVIEPDAADIRAASLVAQMTIDEKIQFIHTDHKSMGDTGGKGAGHIPGLPRLKIPEITMVDSATGSGSGGFKSTVFPANIAVAASWDGALSYEYGAEIARQIRAQGYAMGLGGGANMVRNPRGGRMFEYLGGDPLLAGKLLAERTKATQNEKVIASVKHMVGNEQEAWRGSGSSSIDERTLRQIYMLPFEIAVVQL